MPSTFFGLTIGKSGIYAANAGINTTAHNISNAETEGYSRQQVKQEASTAIRVYNSYGMAGTGVDVKDIVQIRDEYYDQKYTRNNTIYGEYSTKQYYMREIENYFNELNLEGFTTTFNQMYDSLQELSKNPADLTIRTQVTSFGQSFCEYFNFISESVKKIQDECNIEVKNQVERINSISARVASLTKQINTLEVNGSRANDLRDQRALLIDELSEIGSISVKEQVVGDDVGVTNYVVRMDGNTLVDNYDVNRLVCVPRKNLVNQTDVDGLYDVQFENGNGFSLKSGSLGGTFAALLQIRDGNNGKAFEGKAFGSEGDYVLEVRSTNVNEVAKLNIPPVGTLTVGNVNYDYTGFQVRQDPDTNEYIYEFSLDENGQGLGDSYDEKEIVIGSDIAYKGIPYYMAQLSEFVRTYSKAVNDIHKSGQDLNGETGLDFFNGKDKVSGENYVLSRSPEQESDDVLFSSKTGAYAVEEEEKNYGSYYFLTAESFCVTTEVYKDANKVAAASSIVDGIENADNVEKLLALKSDVTMFRQGKPSSFLQTLVSEIGIDADKVNDLSESQGNIVAAITNQRLSISGVDTDEEAMNLIRYQNAYNLSAKVISVMNEIYDRLINYMGA